MVVLIDNGHGTNTPGKCSPDGKLREYKYAREVAIELEKHLTEQGIKAYRITAEDTDIPLSTRISRVEGVCDSFGPKNVCLVSIHCNACPPNDNKWHPARGWSAYTSKGQTRGDILADCLYSEAEIILGKGHYADTFSDNDLKRKNKPIRTDLSDGDKDLEENFAIVAKTSCAAVLTENLFQDNKADVDFLLSEEGKDAIVKLHLRGILKFIKMTTHK